MPFLISLGFSYNRASAIANGQTEATKEEQKKIDVGIIEYAIELSKFRCKTHLKK